MSDVDSPCEASMTWPTGKKPLCGKVAKFRIERQDDTDSYACADHLGHLLEYGQSVIWPPIIEWLGPGERPKQAVVAD